MTHPISQPISDLARWAKVEAAKALETEGLFLNRVLHEQILKTWELERPAMWARLQREGIATDLAWTLQAKASAAEDEYLKAGMTPTDAREQAQREWLLLTAEADDQREAPPL